MKMSIVLYKNRWNFVKFFKPKMYFSSLMSLSFSFPFPFVAPCPPLFSNCATAQRPSIVFFNIFYQIYSLNRMIAFLFCIANYLFAASNSWCQHIFSCHMWQHTCARGVGGVPSHFSSQNHSPLIEKTITNSNIKNTPLSLAHVCVRMSQTEPICIFKPFLAIQMRPFKQRRKNKNMWMDAIEKLCL